MATKDHRVDMQTTIGLISFPHVFASTAGKNDDGEPVYDVQIIIPKSDKEGIRAIARAIKEVGEAKWGANWKKARTPLRDGDKEKDELTEDGSTKGEKYPERLGCYFLNARSKRPVAVVDRERRPIVTESEVYGGMKGKIHVTFYPYAVQGNMGVSAGLNGLQKVADGEPMGGGAPSAESMFDMMDDEDLADEFDLDEDEADDPLEDTEVEDAKPGKKTKAKNKAKGKPSKKATEATKKASKKVQKQAVEEDDLEDLDDDESDLEDMYDDL